MSWFQHILKSKGVKSHLFVYLSAFFAVFLTISLVLYPKDAFESAVNGLNIWWTIVFPSLLPFFILSEILMGFGVVHFIGVLLEPFMRPIFNVPGVGAFALSMGLASGYPMDAVITSKFRKNNMCTAIEAERLLSFTNTADPLFMFGAVAVGMFGRPEVGAIIALAHYIASFMVGVIFRFHRAGQEEATLEETPKKNMILRAFEELYQARQADGRSFGKLLGDAIRESVNTLLLIGGFIILFSVLIRVLTVMGINDHLAGIIGMVLQSVGLEPTLANPIVNGLFEITLGTKAASEAVAPLSQQLMIASAIIAWSGLSVHAQVASIIIESGIRIAPYIFARFLHAFLAAILTIVFFGRVEPVLKEIAVPVFLHVQPTLTLTFWLERLSYFGTAFAMLLATLVSLSIIIQIIKNIRFFSLKITKSK